MTEKDSACEQFAALPDIHPDSNDHEDHVHPHSRRKNHPDPDSHELNHTHSHDDNAPETEQEMGNGHKTVVTIRSYSGLSGDILLTGFALLNLEKRQFSPAEEQGAAWIKEILEKIYAGFGDNVRLVPREVNNVYGWQARVALPHAHEHRNLNDVREIIAKSAISESAKDKAFGCFSLLAHCEAEIHGKDVNEIHFHEVGALDSILDICGVCELFCLYGEPEIICSPLPIADGQINCAHGVLPAPAPATLRLLQNVPLRAFPGSPYAGELVTPTGMALLKILDAKFGKWPSFQLSSSVLVYGQRVFANAPNGVIFASGILE